MRRRNWIALTVIALLCVVPAIQLFGGDPFDTGYAVGRVVGEALFWIILVAIVVSPILLVVWLIRRWRS